MKKGMKEDFSRACSARAYMTLYRSVARATKKENVDDK